MPQQLAPCGTMAAYRRHKRRGEAVDKACQDAMRETSRKQSGRADDEEQSAPVVALPGGFVASTTVNVDARERLIANMQLVERAMEALVTADPLRIIALSTRHSELVAQLVAVSGGDPGGGGPAPEVNPIAQLVASRSASGGATAAPRK